MFVELSDLVAQQGDMVDSIEANVSNAKEYVSWFLFRLILSDKIACSVGFANCFLRVTVVCLPCCQGKLGLRELSEERCAIYLIEVFCHFVKVHTHM